MIISLVELISKFFLWIKRKHIIRPNGDVIKVNLGCGLSVASGWINLDANINILFANCPKFVLAIFYQLSSYKEQYSQEEYCNILKNSYFYHHNFKYGIPFPEGTVDFIYSSHLLEHLFRNDANNLLKEAHRVLKNNGIIRVCVPDLEYIISLYQNGEKERFLKSFFNNSKLNSFSQHKYMYDYELLRLLLEETGFINIKKRSYKQGDTPDIELLDNRPGATLYVEATKGI